MVTAPFCCGQKARAACAQSFALCQQATIEITRHDHFIIACLHHIRGVVARAHSACGEMRIQPNINRKVAKLS